MLSSSPDAIDWTLPAAHEGARENVAAS